MRPPAEPTVALRAPSTFEPWPPASVAVVSAVAAQAATRAHLATPSRPPVAACDTWHGPRGPACGLFPSPPCPRRLARSAPAPWPPCCAPCTPGTVLPQGLGMGCALCLNTLPPDVSTAVPLAVPTPHVRSRVCDPGPRPPSLRISLLSAASLSVCCVLSENTRSPPVSPAGP